jgi:hypothetical protein
LPVICGFVKLSQQLSDILQGLEIPGKSGRSWDRDEIPKDRENSRKKKLCVDPMVQSVNHTMIVPRRCSTGILPECMMVDKLTGSPNIDQGRPRSFKAQLSTRWQRRPALRRRYPARATRSVNFPETVIIFQVNIDTANTEIMEEIVRCALGSKNIRPTVDGVPLFQIAQFLIQFADMLKTPSFRQCLTVHRIKQPKNLRFEHGEPEI